MQWLRCWQYTTFSVLCTINLLTRSRFLSEKYYSQVPNKRGRRRLLNFHFFSVLFFHFWYVWYSFDYYVVLTSFTSCLFPYFMTKHQYCTFMSLFYSLPELTKFLKFRPKPPVYFDPHPSPQAFIKFKKDLRHTSFVYFDLSGSPLPPVC